jgi:hypothetical protein
MKQAAETFMAAELAGKADAVHLTPEDKKIIDEVLVSYWNGKDFTPHFVQALPPESRLITFGPDPKNIGAAWTFVVINTSTIRHSQNWALAVRSTSCSAYHMAFSAGQRGASSLLARVGREVHDLAIGVASEPWIIDRHIPQDGDDHVLAVVLRAAHLYITRLGR